MPSSNANALISELQNYTAQKAISDLIEAGVDEAFLKPMIDIFKNAIYNGSGITDLIDELKQYTLGDPKKLGVLERYIGQVSSDSITQYTANYSKIITDDLNLVFYKYSGNVQKDTRCFCKERVNRFFHQKEIEAWGEGNVTAGGVKSCGFPWGGMIAGTNAGNIFTYRGGWNCEHYIIAVSVYSVPRDVIVRNINNSNYTPSSKVREHFNLAA